MSSVTYAPWSIEATNLPVHAQNPIHTDEGGRAAGFPAALVAGVTVYAYLCHLPLVTHGLAWVQHGGGEVRFKQPVFDLDHVSVRARMSDDETLVEAYTDSPRPRAVLRPTLNAGAAPALRPGDDLDQVTIVADTPYGADYAVPAGDDLDICRSAGVVHPAVWPDLANDIMHKQLARGSWVHTRSIIRHHRAVAVGSEITIVPRVVERFFAHGERAIVDMHFMHNDDIVTSIEHEAIIDLSITD